MKKVNILVTGGEGNIGREGKKPIPFSQFTKDYTPAFK
jgi:hypothetical protein